MSSSKKPSARGKAGSPRKSDKSTGLKDLTVSKRGGSVHGGKRTTVKDSHDKYA